MLSDSTYEYLVWGECTKLEKKIVFLRKSVEIREVGETHTLHHKNGGHESSGHYKAAGILIIRST